MRKIDEFSFIVGVMDCFNEIVKAEVKNIALGAPVDDPTLRDEHAEFAEGICQKYGTKYYKDDDALLTDLFEASMNRDKHNLVFYKYDRYLDEYLNLKQRKKELISRGEYKGDARYQIAYEFGKLLSYSDEAIRQMIEKNHDKEEF